MQNANAHRPGFAKRIARHLRLWHKLLDMFLVCAQSVIAKGGYVIIEWPSRCRYWNDPRVVELLSCESLGWQSGRARACAFGSVESGKHAGKALSKVWRIDSTMPGLREALSLPCPGGHEHVTSQGTLTSISARYPSSMARTFHRCFATQSVCTTDFLLNYFHIAR